MCFCHQRQQKEVEQRCACNCVSVESCLGITLAEVLSLAFILLVVLGRRSSGMFVLVIFSKILANIARNVPISSG